MGCESVRPVRALSCADFECTAIQIASNLQTCLLDVTRDFLAEFQLAASAEGYRARVQGLDPTKKLIVDVMVEWTNNRNEFTTIYNTPGFAGRSPRLPPTLELFILGTAGSGKNHAANLGVTEVRIASGPYGSVLAMACRGGVASGNLEAGSRTIGNIFHTSRGDAAEDLIGADLDNLVDELQHAQLIVVDNISTFGAASLEVVSKRMQQVARVLWRTNIKGDHPANMGPFGGGAWYSWATFPICRVFLARFLWRACFSWGARVTAVFA